MAEQSGGEDKDRSSQSGKSATGKSSSAYRTIGEVADELGVEQHVLRFWETKFSQVKPMKRAGGRRYYRPEDVKLLAQIRDLLRGEGYTIKGVQRLLKEKGKEGLESSFEVTLSSGAEREIRAALQDLEAARDTLAKAVGQ